MTYNNWNVENEIYCQQIGERAASYNWMHLKSERYYCKWARMLAWILNIFTIISAIISVIASFWNSDALEVIIKIFAIITAAFVKYYTSNKIRHWQVYTRS